jgi:uncharacterized membrane protein YfcA
MLFQTAGIEVAFWIPPLVAFVISFFTSMGGISGAFLLLPFQMSVLGYTTPSVSATNQLYNVVATPSGVYRYWKERRFVWPLTLAVMVGALPGVFIGVFVRILYLPDPRNFKLFAAAVLFFIGAKLVRDLLKKSAGDDTSSNKPNASAPTGSPHIGVTHFNWKRLGYTYYDDEYDVSFWGIFALSFVIGIVGGIYGIGGGAIMAPFLVTFLRLPVHTIACTALAGTFVTSVAGVAIYQLIAPLFPDMSVAPDWRLGILFGLGGMAGIYLGARCQKFVPAKAIKWMLAGVIMFTVAKYVIGFLKA